MEWMKEQVKKYTQNIVEINGDLYQTIDGETVELSKEAEYWLAVDCVLSWVQGMWKGLVEANTTLSYDQFIALPYMADMEDILTATGGFKYRDEKVVFIFFIS